ncbi:atp-dependent helicase [Methylobacterium sp. J-026]|uniref:atp-dependent helicase n=1 Tax=Methylobacterium sp. J-026 TaxID=2836624 RepID=UPI001FBAA9D8|nr:atp-dependent helicase [Methylobacterium sp. J-026]MCJ2137950.1 atp-dependent helicase [Methylobacterium sp. J-026]
MTVTGDETSVQDLLKDLRETQARLEAAQAEAASLKVLLALRTHQYDQAWQAGQRAAAELDVARSGEVARTAERADAWAREADLARQLDAARAAATSLEAVARAEARADAVRTVLGAVLASLRAWGLDRRRFRGLIDQASREAPDAGSGAERHAVLLAEARRVLGLTE